LQPFLRNNFASILHVYIYNVDILINFGELSEEFQFFLVIGQTNILFLEIEECKYHQI